MGLTAEVTDWIKGWAADIDGRAATTIASAAVDPLLGKRSTHAVFRTPATIINDERHITEWTAMLAGASKHSRHRANTSQLCSTSQMSVASQRSPRTTCTNRISTVTCIFLF